MKGDTNEVKFSHSIACICIDCRSAPVNHCSRYYVELWKLN